MLSTLISNALDNALNAQLNLPPEKRNIDLMLKDSRGHLLLSIKNPYGEEPLFQDGIPIARQKDHGYGTKSIVYLSQKMGGNCQFTLHNDLFVLRVMI